MTNTRLIETFFPLQQTSVDSVHEKNVRHGGCVTSGTPASAARLRVGGDRTGLEAFSRYPVVKLSDAAGRFLTVAEFLRRVRRMVVGFVVSRLLAGDDAAAGELDDVTTWYLLHRTDFGFDPAPAGACILYALSCNLSDTDLAGGLDLLARGGRTASADEDAPEEADDGESGAGGDVRLKPWNRRRARGLGEPAADGAAPPLVDCVHALMHRWKTGEQSRVDAYLEARGLWRHELFARVVQALIELADAGSDERATLESIQNHLRARDGAKPRCPDLSPSSLQVRTCALGRTRVSSPGGATSNVMPQRSAPARRVERASGLI